MGKPYEGKIPFDKDGNLMTYTWARQGTKPDSEYAEGRRIPRGEWRDNYEFEAQLRFDGFVRGRSAARAQFYDLTNGVELEMFLADLEKLLTLPASDERSFIGGQVEGRWTFCKRGSNYGVTPA